MKKRKQFSISQKINLKQFFIFCFMIVIARISRCTLSPLLLRINGTRESIVWKSSVFVVVIYTFKFFDKCALFEEKRVNASFCASQLFLLCDGNICSAQKKWKRMNKTKSALQIGFYFVMTLFLSFLLFCVYSLNFKVSSNIFFKINLIL